MPPDNLTTHLTHLQAGSAAGPGVTSSGKLPLDSPPQYEYQSVCDTQGAASAAPFGLPLLRTQVHAHPSLAPLRLPEVPLRRVGGWVA